VSGFKDHFSSHSAGYAAFRPRYPQALADALADLCPAANLALDCGCGTGQLSVLLAERFDKVVATDASPQQIAAAEPHPGVEYRVAPAERSGLEQGSADLIVAAQAAHWFDLPAFYAEARRVGRPGALLALVSYATVLAEPGIDGVIQHFYGDVLGPYWPPERRHVEEGYRSFAFPFAELTPPSLAIEVAWSRDELFGYIDTWSAVRNTERALGRGPIEQFAGELAAAWGDAAHRRTFRFPLAMRLGRM